MRDEINFILSRVQINHYLILTHINRLHVYVNLYLDKNNLKKWNLNRNLFHYDRCLISTILYTIAHNGFPEFQVSKKRKK